MKRPGGEFQLSHGDQLFLDELFPKVPVEERKAAEETLKAWLNLSTFLEQLAAELFPPDLCQNLSDDELAAMVADLKGKGSDSTYLRTFLDELDLGPENTEDRSEYELPMRLALRRSVVDEYIKRYYDQETPAGRAVRAFRNEPTEENHKLLIKHIIKRFSWHPEYAPEEAREAREEILSMAHVALCERLAKIPRWREHFRERLMAMISGQYNRIAERTHESVKEQLETIDRRQETFQHVSIDATDDEPELSSPQKDRILLDMEMALPRAKDQKALIDERIEERNAKLTTEDNRVLSMYREGYTQEVIAAKLNKTQAAISQQLAKIRSKLR